MKKILTKFVDIQNSKKKLFTPGPASLLAQNLSSIVPCFGRGDKQYEKIEAYVLNKLQIMTGHKYIARMQGAGSLGLEVMINNFIYGKLLIIKTGTYSDRLYLMSKASKKNFRNIKKIDYIDYKNLNDINIKYDWVMGCPVETSIGLKISISKFNKLKKRCSSKLALDATASIGLENNHQYADVLSYSSCKGLFGLTGAAFVAFNSSPTNEINQFNLNIYNHIDKKMTGPYHAISSLFDVLKSYNDFKYAVVKNKEVFLKKMSKYLVYNNEEQPNLCTLINKEIFKKDKNVILYQSRADISGSVVCHLGEVHLMKKAKGQIINFLKLNK
jgi:aspartate aminotransferase-like enzyme